MRQAIFILLVIGLFSSVGYYYYEHSVTNVPVNRSIEEQAQEVDLNTWEVESAGIIARRYGFPVKQMYAIAAELHVLRATHKTVDEEYVLGLCKRRGLRESDAATRIYEYTVYLSSLRAIP